MTRLENAGQKKARQRKLRVAVSSMLDQIIAINDASPTIAIMIAMEAAAANLSIQRNANDAAASLGYLAKKLRAGYDLDF